MVGPVAACRRDRPTLSDAELVTPTVMSALLGYTSERRRLRRVERDFGHLFPYVPQQSGYNKRLRAASSLITSMIRILARDTTLWSDDVWLVDSTRRPRLFPRDGQALGPGGPASIRLPRVPLKVLPGPAAAPGVHARKPADESINQTFTGQLDLERHGGKSPAGVSVRVLCRILALTAAI